MVETRGLAAHESDESPFPPLGIVQPTTQNQDKHGFRNPVPITSFAAQPWRWEILGREQLKINKKKKKRSECPCTIGT